MVLSPVKAVNENNNNKKKHQVSVTPGKHQQGDLEGDGPSKEECDKEYFRRMARIWLNQGNDNLFRLAELREKYAGQDIYSYYVQVCQNYGINPEPPLPIESVEVEAQEQEERAASLAAMAAKVEEAEAEYAANAEAVSVAAPDAKVESSVDIEFNHDSSQCEKTKDEVKHDTETNINTETEKLTASNEKRKLEQQCEFQTHAKTEVEDTLDTQPEAKKKRRGKKKRLTGDQRRNRMWTMLEEAEPEIQDQQLQDEYDVDWT